jgi:hypothetical protein
MHHYRLSALFTSCIPGILALLLVLENPGVAAAARHPTPRQLIQRVLTTAVPLYEHSDANVRVSDPAFRPMSGPVYPLHIRAHVITDCVVAQKPALRIHVLGTVRAGNRPSRALDGHYTILTSPKAAANANTIFWERSSSTGSRWQRKTTVAAEPAFIAFQESGSCPDTSAPIRIATLPGAHVAGAGTRVVGGRNAWAIKVTYVKSVQHFSFVVAIDKATYRILQTAGTYSVRRAGHGISSFTYHVTYSRFNMPVTVSAPKAGATSP